MEPLLRIPSYLEASLKVSPLLVFPSILLSSLSTTRALNKYVQSDIVDMLNTALSFALELSLVRPDFSSYLSPLASVYI